MAWHGCVVHAIIEHYRNTAVICFHVQANLPVQHAEPKLRNMGTSDGTKWLDSASHTATYTIGDFVAHNTALLFAVRYCAHRPDLQARLRKQQTLT